MLLRARRWAGALLLASLVAMPTTMVEPATALASSGTSTKSSSSTGKSTVRKKTGKRSTSTKRLSSAKSKKKRTGVRKRVAKRRAPPAGGVYSRSAVVVDPATGAVLYEKNAGKAVPIASLTKLLTAMVFLELHPDLSREVPVTMAEIRGGGRTQLRNGESVALGDLLHMSLMNSDNVATRVMARESGVSHDEFIARMNRKATQLGMDGSRFHEVTGLDERNVATATDVARLVKASAANPLIQEITTTHTYEFRGRLRNAGRAHMIHNTNRLLKSRYEVNCGKTGFISEAGYCLATWVNDKGRDMIAVVLGAPTNATRFADVVRLVQRTEVASATSGIN